MSKTRMSCDRVEWAEWTENGFKLVYRGADGELMQWFVEYSNHEQRVFARRVMFGLCTIAKDLKANGIEQMQPPAVGEPV